MIDGKGQESPNVRSFIQGEKVKSINGGSFLSQARSTVDPQIQVYDEGHENSFLNNN